MFYSFKIRLLMVIALAAVLGLVMQSDSPGKQSVEPVLRYIMTSDDELTRSFNQLVSRPGRSNPESLPASVQTMIKSPCDYLTLEQQYGSYWDQAQEREAFNPGMYFKVAANTPVKAVLPGTVQAATRKNREYTVKIKHLGGLESIYGGLQEIEVQVEHPVLLEQVIGKTGEQFYFEMRSNNNPVDPRSIFE